VVCPQERSSGVAAAESRVAELEQRAAETEENATQLARANAELEATLTTLQKAVGAEDPKVFEQVASNSNCP
jgi:uncharacterized coiled-coil protein SlyX